VTHFDLANNYGPPYGRAEENFGRYLAEGFKGLRDELIISTKAGWDMWPGPYGQGGGSGRRVWPSGVRSGPGPSSGTPTAGVPVRERPPCGWCWVAVS
jgi:aryl-alcohol dehydrogenase-like predicted oxidoreductase